MVVHPYRCVFRCRVAAGFAVVSSWSGWGDAQARLTIHDVNLTALAPPGFSVATGYLNGRGEVAGTLENLTTIQIAAFVFDGHTLVLLRPPKGYHVTISFGISSTGSVLALALTDIQQPPVAYLAVPGRAGYRWSKLPFDPTNGDCRPLMAANGDIAGGTSDIPCELWQRRSDGSYSRPVDYP